jgi:hypothetical protein
MDYKKLKYLFTIMSLVFFISNYIDNIEHIPIINLPLNKETDIIVYCIYSAIFVFCLIHLFNERTNYNIKFEVSFISILFIIVTIVNFRTVIFSYLPEISSSLLVSFLIAYFSHILIEELTLIRNREEARKLNLPTYPSSVIAIIIGMTVLSVIIFCGWLYFAINYLDWLFIKQNIHFLLISFLLFLIFFLREEIYLRLKIFNWEELKVEKETTKKTREHHDRRYQELGLVKIKFGQSRSNELYSYIRKDDSDSIETYFLKGNDPDEVFSFGFTALVFAAAEGSLNAVNKIIEHGADVNVKNSKGITALCFAARYNHHEIAEVLLNNGADPNECSIATETPLQIATIYGHEGIVKLLLNTKDIDIERKTLVTNKSALELAMDHGHGEIAKMIRKKLRTLGS